MRGFLWVLRININFPYHSKFHGSPHHPSEKYLNGGSYAMGCATKTSTPVTRNRVPSAFSSQAFFPRWVGSYLLSKVVILSYSSARTGGQRRLDRMQRLEAKIAPTANH